MQFSNISWSTKNEKNIKKEDREKNTKHKSLKELKAKKLEILQEKCNEAIELTLQGYTSSFISKRLALSTNKIKAAMYKYHYGLPVYPKKKRQKN